MNQDNNRITLYLDADDTILLSSEAVIKILNKKYNIYPEYKTQWTIPTILK